MGWCCKGIAYKVPPRDRRLLVAVIFKQTFQTNQRKKVKFLIRMALLGALATSNLAWADAGPYYVSYPAYCNVLKVYINAKAYVYGTEVGCSSILGKALVGAILADGRAVVSQVASGTTSPCIDVYGTDGTVTGGCSAGSPVSYSPDTSYTVRQSLTPQTSSEHAPNAFTVSTEMPDLERTKDLPQRP